MYKQLISSVFGILLMAVALMMADGCKHEPDLRKNNNPTDTSGNPIDTTKIGNPCSPDTVYFEKDIMPLLVSNCAKSGCHDAITQKEGIVLTDYANTLATGKIKPGNPSGSDMIEVIMETDPKKIMPPPPNQPLTTEQKEMLRKWIAQGAQNLKCTSGCDTLNVTWTSPISRIINNNCKGCHSGTVPAGNISLTDYATVKTQALNGKLLGAVKRDAGYKAMPPNGMNPLSTCDINAIRKWTEKGAPE